MFEKQEYQRRDTGDWNIEELRVAGGMRHSQRQTV